MHFYKEVIDGDIVSIQSSTNSVENGKTDLIEIDEDEYNNLFNHWEE